MDNSYMESDTKEQLEHIILNKTGSDEIHCCAECEFSAKSWEELNNHSMSYHQNDSSFAQKKKYIVCHICDKLFLQKRYLKNHMAVKHFRSQGFSCADCNYTCHAKKVIKNHIEKIHLKLLSSCSYCNLEFLKRIDFRKHLSVIHGVVSHACPHCTYTSIDLSYLNRHIRRKHINRDKKSYKCDECDFACRNRKNLSDHIQNIHKHEKIYCCDICSYTTYWKHSLDGHKQVHVRDNDVEAISCQYCSFKSKSEDYIKRHISKNHIMDLIDANNLT